MVIKNEIILKSQQRFKSEAHHVYAEEINKIVLSSNDDKISVVDTARLTGWVKPGEIWQLNFWIWIFQAKENYFRIHYSMKIWTLLRSFYSERFLSSRGFAHSHFASTHHFLAFPILIFYRMAFWVKKYYTRSVSVDTFN